MAAPSMGGVGKLRGMLAVLEVDVAYGLVVAGSVVAVVEPY